MSLLRKSASLRPRISIRGRKTYTDPATRLEVRCEATLFTDSPAAEWVLSFRNGGSADTPLLETLRPASPARVGGLLTGTCGGGLTLQAGPQASHFVLHPGEAVRTPRILLVAWHGNGRFRGCNLLRRLLLDHYVPRQNGRIAVPPISNNTWFTYGADLCMNVLAPDFSPTDARRASAVKNWKLAPAYCCIGAQAGGSAKWNGSIDDVRIYNRALSAADVSSLAGH